MTTHDPIATAAERISFCINAGIQLAAARAGRDAGIADCENEVADILKEVFAGHALIPLSTLREVRDAMKECLVVAEECYEATGHFKIAKTSVQRLKIESALSKLTELIEGSKDG